MPYNALNVKTHFGAKGDNATDDTVAIQNAIDNAPFGATLFFPHGQYLISGTIFVDRGALVLAGEGRGHADGGGTRGASIKWNGASDGSPMMRIFSNGTGRTIHGITVRDIGLDGDGNNVHGVLLGTKGAEASPKAFVGTLERVWVTNMSGIGVQGISAQLCNFDYVHAFNCGTGIAMGGDPDSSACTACTFTSCRTYQNDVGLYIDSLQNSIFTQHTSESNRKQGVIMRAGGPHIVQSITFNNLWLENNLTDSGVGKGVHFESWTDALIGSNDITFNDVYMSTISNLPGNYSMVLGGGTFFMRRPWMHPSTNIHLKSQTSPNNFKTYLYGYEWRWDPNTRISADDSQAGSVRAWIEEYEDNVSPNKKTWILNNTSGTLGSSMSLLKSETAGVTAFAAFDATPSIQDGERWRTANTSGTLITNFDDGFDGKHIHVIVDKYTTIQHNENIRLHGSLNFAPGQGGAISLLQDTGVWHELGRSVL